MNLFGALYAKSIKDVREHFRKKKENKNTISNREKLLTSYLNSYGSEPKLQIGCGVNVVEGWFNTDILYNDKVAYLNAGEKFPFEGNSFQFIYAEHLFEHLTLDQEIVMLHECMRTLKPGGVLRLALPSADFLMNILSGEQETTPYVEWAVNNIPGLDSVKKNVTTKEDYPVYVVNNFYRDWGHQTIHNKQTLRNLLDSCGYINIVETKVGESKHDSLQNMERHMVSLPEDLNKLETMIIEASKPQ